jgi:hypothetical protein
MNILDPIFYRTLFYNFRQWSPRACDTLEIQMTCTTRHVTLRLPFRRKCRCQLTFFIFFENITWHFGFEVECQMKFVKYHTYLPNLSIMITSNNTHCQSTPKYIKTYSMPYQCLSNIKPPPIYELFGGGRYG